MTSTNLPWNGLTAQLFLKFLLIRQHEFKMVDWPNREWQKIQMPRIFAQDVGIVFMRIIFADLIIHTGNYRSNQSAHHDQMRDRFASSVWNVFLLTKHHSGQKRRKMAVFAGYCTDYTQWYYSNLPIANRRVGCNTLVCTVAFLYSNWLYFLWCSWKKMTYCCCLSYICFCFIFLLNWSEDQARNTQNTRTWVL